MKTYPHENEAELKAAGIERIARPNNTTPQPEDETMATKKHTMTRNECGGWLYRGYLLEHPELEDGTISNDWDIMAPDRSDTYDRLPTRWQCVESIDEIKDN